MLVIRRRYAAGDGSTVSLGREYGVHADTIYGVVTGQYWSHVPATPEAPIQTGPLLTQAVQGERNVNAKLTEADVRAIRVEYTGRPGQIMTIARRYGMDRHVIANVVHRKSWKHVE